MQFGTRRDLPRYGATALAVGVVLGVKLAIVRVPLAVRTEERS